MIDKKPNIMDGPWYLREIPLLQLLNSTNLA